MNEVVLTGRLAKDPEVRYTQNNMAVCRFTLAVDRAGRRQNSGNEQTADFISITAFDRVAENCSRYLLKGSQAAVLGRIQTGSYRNSEGRNIYTTSVVASRVEFMGSRVRPAESTREDRRQYYPAQQNAGGSKNGRMQDDGGQDCTYMGEGTLY